MHQQILLDNQKGDFTNLELLHHMTSGMKAYLTKSAYEGIDILRESIGAAGLLKNNGIGPLMLTFMPTTTGEGDSVVMY